MIPLNLKMRNFMCYRGNVPALSFAGMHTACLSGDNGNGKSALIDAITWALWGKARAKSDDDLIHSNENEMEVEFDFAVEQQPYRVIRKRSRPRRPGGTGQSILEFQTSTGNGYKSISGSSIAHTQQEIIDKLHMDYDTFINSAFLRQGHADEFTTRRPAERKEVVATILGLSYYDELEEQARELARKQEMTRAQLENALQEIAGELAMRSTYEAELAEAQRLLSQMEEILGKKEAALNELKQQKEALEKKKVQLEQLEASIGDRGRSLHLLEAQAEQHRSRIKEYEAVIAQRAAIEEGYGQFMQARARHDELDRIFRQSVALERRKRELEDKISQAGRELDREHARVQQSIADCEDKIQKFARKREEVQQLQSLYSQLNEQEEALRQKKEACQELQTQVNRLESQQAQLEKEIRGLEEKIDLIAGGTEARCPLCETELGAEGLKLIESKYSAERESKAALLAFTRSELAQQKGKFEAQQNELSREERDLTQRKLDLQSRAAELNREAREAQEATRERERAKERLTEIEQLLQKKDFAAAEQEALTALEKEMAGLAYDAAQHEQVRQKKSDLERYEDSKRKLDDAVGRIDQERDAASRAEAASQELRQGLEADDRKRQELASALHALPGLVEELAAAQEEHRTLSQQQKQAQELVWQVKAKLQRCDEMQQRKKEREKQLNQAAREEGIYKELARAFGKGGIQALLIETALPEIEIEANRLLERMTDNRMHVKFETQRATKKGDVIETLDITISDELGTRNYEMFSGGEAFRINFAIRIALSRLLARRAGAPLPTLIIDEGFGTQDATGIEKLKEAINSIQDDFKKILVITHIEELRDAFPTRIDVVKTGEGSTISVN